MGKYKYYWHCRQLRLGEDLSGSGDCVRLEPALGRNTINGTAQLKPFTKTY